MMWLVLSIIFLLAQFNVGGGGHRRRRQLQGRDEDLVCTGTEIKQAAGQAIFNLFFLNNYLQNLTFETGVIGLTEVTS
jgi:hypothetical protein